MNRQSNTGDVASGVGRYAHSWGAADTLQQIVSKPRLLPHSSLHLVYVHTEPLCSGTHWHVPAQWADDQGL